MGGSIELQETLDDIGKAVATGTEYEVGEGVVIGVLRTCDRRWKEGGDHPTTRPPVM